MRLGFLFPRRLGRGRRKSANRDRFFPAKPSVAQPLGRNAAPLRAGAPITWHDSWFLKGMAARLLLACGGATAGSLGGVRQMKSAFRYGQLAFLAGAVLSISAIAALAQTPAPAPAAAAPKLDTGDTAWMLTSTALVLM